MLSTKSFVLGFSIRVSHLYLDLWKVNRSTKIVQIPKPSQEHDQRLNSTCGTGKVSGAGFLPSDFLKHGTECFDGKVGVVDFDVIWNRRHSSRDGKAVRKQVDEPRQGCLCVSLAKLWTAAAAKPKSCHVIPLFVNFLLLALSSALSILSYVHISTTSFPSILR